MRQVPVQRRQSAAPRLRALTLRGERHEREAGGAQRTTPSPFRSCQSRRQVATGRRPDLHRAAYSLLRDRGGRWVGDRHPAAMGVLSRALGGSVPTASSEASTSAGYGSAANSPRCAIRRESTTWTLYAGGAKYLLSAGPMPVVPASICLSADIPVLHLLARSDAVSACLRGMDRGDASSLLGGGIRDHTAAGGADRGDRFARGAQEFPARTQRVSDGWADRNLAGSAGAPALAVRGCARCFDL